MGNKLVVSFANPAKHYDTHAIRPQNNGMSFASVVNAAPCVTLTILTLFVLIYFTQVV